MKALRALALVATALAVAGVALPAAAGPAKQQTKQGPKMYKWKDKDGVWQYGSAIPPEYADQQKEQINAQGQTIKTIEGALTPEQRAAKEKEQQEAEAAKEQLARDKVLLSTYGSVGDIERAREKRLAAIQGQINMASGAVTSLETEIVRLEKQSAATKDAKQKEKYDAQLAKQRRELNANQRAVVIKQDEKATVAAQFDHDIERFKAMTKPVEPKASAPKN